MSTKTVEGGLLAVEKSDVVMVTCNLKHKEELPVIEFAYKNKKGILVKKAFASGHITTEKIDNPVQKSIDFIFSQKGVSSIILGTLNYKHLLQNVNAANKALY